MQRGRAHHHQSKWEVPGIRIVDPSLEPLRPIFEKWIWMIPRYAKRTESVLAEPDYFFWYNERASVGSVAAAAWLADGVALEEYSAPRRRASKYRGRADLWIVIDGEQFTIEAKPQWVGIGTRALNSATQSSQELLGIAKKDAASLRENGGCRVGLVFAVPSLPAGDRDRLESVVGGFLDETKDLGVSMVWWFDTKHPPHDDGEGRLYPGVVMLLERA